MATAKEVEKELAIALKEIGSIRPEFDKRTNDWGFPINCIPSNAVELRQKRLSKNTLFI